MKDHLRKLALYIVILSGIALGEMCVLKGEYIAYAFASWPACFLLIQVINRSFAPEDLLPDKDKDYGFIDPLSE